MSSLIKARSPDPQGKIGKMRPKALTSATFPRVRWILPLLLSLPACSGGGQKPRSPPKPAIYRFAFAGPELDCPPPSHPDGPCAPANLDACVEALRHAPQRDAPPFRSLWHVLERACVSQGPCACAVYADALMLSAKPARQLEGLRLLDASCGAGVIRACDEGLLLATICAELQENSPLCDELRQQNALPEVHREPDWEPRPLPSSLQACFEGDVTDTDTAFGCVFASCSDAPKKKLAVCLEPSRLLWLTDVWDEQPVQWKWRAGRWHAFDGTSEVASVGVEGTELRFGDSHAFSRVPSARNTGLQREVAALPTVQQACDARSRCERTLVDVLRHTGEANDGASGEGEGLERSLAGCLRSLHNARRELNVVAPARAQEACVLPNSHP
jgi:hypothetical protein